MARPGHGGAGSRTRSLRISLADLAPHTSPDEVLGKDSPCAVTTRKRTSFSTTSTTGALYGVFSSRCVVFGHRHARHNERSCTGAMGTSAPARYENYTDFECGEG